MNYIAVLLLILIAVSTVSAEISIAMEGDIIIINHSTGDPVKICTRDSDMPVFAVNDTPVITFGPEQNITAVE